jgi:hypothetical protein
LSEFLKRFDAAAELEGLSLKPERITASHRSTGGAGTRHFLHLNRFTASSTRISPCSCISSLGRVRHRLTVLSAQCPLPRSQSRLLSPAPHDRPPPIWWLFAVSITCTILLLAVAGVAHALTTF